MSEAALETQGYAIIGEVLTPTERVEIISAVESADRRRAGTRNLLREEWCVALAQRLRAHPALANFLERTPQAIQCTFFDKTPEINWLVPMHQDLSIPVQRRVSHPALGTWSEKEEQLFVQAPRELLDRLLAVRVHLDACGKDDGALRVAPGSHHRGPIESGATGACRDELGEEVCEVQSGGAMLMRPLLLHASSKARSAAHRRVLHFLFAPESPGYGLEWPSAHLLRPRSRP